MAHRSSMATAAIAVVLCGGTAFAQQPEVIEREYLAPKKTFEIGVGAGYSQGTGQVVDVGERVSDFARAGAEAQLDLGYRLHENWFVGGYGSYAYYRSGANAPDGSDTYGITAGAQGQYHFRPLRRWDPWVGFGLGYRGLFENRDTGPTESRHGIQLMRFRFGVDLRASPGVALGPQLGIDATMFTGIDRAATSGVERISTDNLSVSTFFFAGVGGRFDFNTERIPSETRRMAYAF